MADTHIEVSHQNWFGRVGDSIKGILFGIIVIPLCLILLWWNEGRAVTTAKSLKEGAAAVVSVAADPVDPANDKKLVHVTGDAAAPGAVRDPDFGLSVAALRLMRSEEIYQWTEHKRTEKKEKFGGGEESKTIYTYEKKWTDEPVQSSHFKDPAGHANKGELIAGNSAFAAEGVTLGAFQIPVSMVRLMGEPVKRPVTEADLDRLPADLKEAAQVHAGAFYFGQQPDAPQIGDVRVSYMVVPPGTFSVVAAQNGRTFEPYQTKAGNEISLVEPGTVSAEAMFKNAAEANTLITWALRIGGFLFMSFGFMALMRPLSVLGSVVPFVGSLVGMGTGLVAFVLAAVISLFVIALAWLAARPLLGLVLLALVVAGILGLRKMAAASRSAAPPPPPPAG